MFLPKSLYIGGLPISVLKRGVPEPKLSNPSFALMSGSVATNGTMTADGFTWAQGRPMLADQFEKFISIAQWSNSGTNTNSFIVSNDGGATWEDPTHTSFAAGGGELFLIRGACAYDNINDIVHVLWNAVSSSDGVIYRRYSVTRDGSNNITGFTRVSGVNLQLDYQNTGTMSYVHPVLIFCEDIGANGALVAIWGARNSASGTGTRSEVRASMRVLSNTTADNTAGNWVAPVSATTSAIGQSPQVAYSAIASKAAAATPCHPSAERFANGDIHFVYNDGDNTQEYFYRRMIWNSVSSNWSTGLSSEVKMTDEDRVGNDAGYDLKFELLTALHLDPVTGDIYVGFSTWNGADTWSFARITPEGTVTVVDVYTSDSGDNGASDFVTGDVMYDTNKKRLVVAYTDLPAKHVFMSVYKGVTQTQTPIAVFTDRPFDIPTIYPATVDGNVLVLGRDFNDASTNNPPTYTPPYDGYFGTVLFQ